MEVRHFRSGNLTRHETVEEESGKETLSSLEEMDPRSPAFEKQLTALRADVPARSEAKQNQEFHHLGPQ
ncbi:hypothetical protein AQJ27_36570 [Streptomyces olivochromogenes]|nr:hypothetical protein AQJ27_36570 [Streptomyces olivochromogenes]